jgi:protein SCO1
MPRHARHPFVGLRKELLRRLASVAAVSALAACDPASARQEASSTSAIENLVVQAPVIDFPLPDFTLTDQNKNQVKRADLEGKVWVASFIFTSCPTICPRLTARFATLQAALLENDDVRFVSISVDPETDTPEKLSAFATKHGATSPRWLFLTGDPKVVDATVLTGFKMVLQRSTAGSVDISHAERFCVVDRKAHVRGLFDTSDQGLAALKARVGELRAEK